MRYFTSDTHFGHANIIDYCGRPFGSLGHMHEDLISRWNSVVSDDDEVVVVGDVAMGRLEDSLALVRRLAGNKLLVPGNHDKCWAGRQGEKARAMYEAAGFAVLDEQVTFDLGGHAVDICHFPFTGDSGSQDRFESWRPQDQGQWLIHGHVHERWRLRGRAINVGIDAWAGELVRETQIIELIEAGPGELDRLIW